MLAVVADTWFRELRDTDSLYTEVGPEELFAHLQAGCTGRHALDLKVVALHLVMKRQEVKGVPAGTPRLEVCKKFFWADLSV